MEAWGLHYQKLQEGGTSFSKEGPARMASMSQGGSVIPVFTSGTVTGSMVEGRFLPGGAEADFTLDFEMPGSGYYGVVVPDSRMDPPVKPGDVIIACPDISLALGAPAVAKIAGRPDIVIGSYHSTGTGTVRLVPANERYELVEVMRDELEWIHPTIITVPGRDFRKGTIGRRRKGRRSDA